MDGALTGGLLARAVGDGSTSWADRLAFHAARSTIREHEFDLNGQISMIFTHEFMISTDPAKITRN
jgi:hypothetical protein